MTVLTRLVTRGLVAEGRGSSEYEALYDLLSCLYIAPVSANPFLRLGAFLKLWIWNGAPFSKAIRLFSRPKHSAEERQIVRLANQALLSSAELIKCAERGVRTLRSDAQLMDCLYDDELTTCENLAYPDGHVPASPPCLGGNRKPVSAQADRL